MLFSDILASAVGALRRRPLRTALTSLGVTIGTMSVVVMISLGVGLTRQMGVNANSPTLRQVEVFGTPQPETGQKKEEIDDALVQKLRDFDGVQHVFPVYAVQTTLKAGGQQSWAEIVGMPSQAFLAMEIELAWGSFPQAAGMLTLLVGSKVDQTMWNVDGNPVDIDWRSATVFLTPESGMGFDDGMNFDIPGDEQDDGLGEEGGGETTRQPPRPIVARASGEIYEEGDYWTAHSWSIYADLDVLVAALAKAVPGEKLPGQESVNAKPGRAFTYTKLILMADSSDHALDLLTSLRDAGYDAQGEAEWIAQMQKDALVYQAVLGGIGAISMLVAAIGIANTMLMSVYERQRDIGVMKVIGASLADIRRLFLVESSSIGFLGGLLGVAFSYVLSAVINAVAASSTGSEMGVSYIPPWLALGALVGATLIAMVSGFAPARRAMRLSPLAAIRAQ